MRTIDENQVVSRCIGRIRIASNLLRSNPVELTEVFRLLKFLPVRVDYYFSVDALEYLGVSPEFQVVAKGGAAPFYDITVTSEFDPKTETVKVLSVIATLCGERTGTALTSIFEPW